MPIDPAKHPALVRVVCDLGIGPDGNREAGVGTGSIIDSNGSTASVLTAAHVIDGAKMIQIQTVDGRRFAATAIEVDATQDVALLKIEDPRVGTYILGADESPRIGDPVWAIGASDGLVSYSGNVRQFVSGDLKTYTWLEMGCRVKQGTSGGPIINSRGHLIGIVSACDLSTVGPCLPRLRSILAWVFRKRNASPVVPVVRPTPPIADMKPTLPPAPTTEASKPIDPVEPLGIRVGILERSIEALRKIPGTAGPKGEQGPPGRDGSNGRDGKPASLSDQQANALANVPTLIERLKEHKERLDSLPGVEAIKQTAAETALAAVAEKLPDMSSAVTPAATSLLVSLGVPGGIAVVGAAAASWFATRGVKRAVAKLSSDLAASRGGPCTNQNTAGQYAGGSATTVLPIVTGSPPSPQLVSRESTYVPVEVPQVELEAIQWAMDNYVQRNPGGRATVEAIKNAADQYTSGHPRRKS